LRAGSGRVAQRSLVPCSASVFQSPCDAFCGPQEAFHARHRITLHRSPGDAQGRGDGEAGGKVAARTILGSALRTEKGATRAAPCREQPDHQSPEGIMPGLCAMPRAGVWRKLHPMGRALLRRRHQSHAFRPGDMLWAPSTPVSVSTFHAAIGWLTMSQVGIFVNDFAQLLRAMTKPN
jgi:hypothetical protein